MRHQHLRVRKGDVCAWGDGGWFRRAPLEGAAEIKHRFLRGLLA